MLEGLKNLIKFLSSLVGTTFSFIVAALYSSEMTGLVNKKISFNAHNFECVRVLQDDQNEEIR